MIGARLRALRQPFAATLKLRHEHGSGSLLARLAVASGLLATLIAIAFAVLVITLSSLRDSTEAARRAKDVTAATLILENHVVELESGLRGFVLTGDERFLQPWRRALDALPRASLEVERLVAGTAQLQRARNLSTLIDAYVRDYSMPLVEIARLSPGAARASVARVEGKRRLDEIQAQFDRFLTLEDATAKELVQHARDRSRLAIIFGIVALVASAGLVFAFGLYLATSIVRPVRRTAEAAAEVARGELGTRIPDEGPGELLELTRAFNAMAASLERGTRELQAQNERLRESERLKAELVSIVSHELRTPLASVLGYSSLLLDRQFDDETRRHYLEIISSEGRRLGALVDDFLEIRRLEEPGLELRMEPVDLGEVLRDQVRVHERQSDQHELTLELGGRALVVDGDRGRLEQVVGNFIGNAIKYSPDGGSVRVGAETADGLVRVSVHDEGIGIPDEHRAQIFTKFFRGGARASGIAGTGLGLAIAREIIEAHDGRIGFDSAAGQGSVFWFELPASASGP